MGQNSRGYRNKTEGSLPRSSERVENTKRLALGRRFLLHVSPLIVFPRPVHPAPLALPFTRLSIQLLLIFIFLWSACVCLFPPPRTTPSPPPLTPAATEL